MVGEANYIYKSKPGGHFVLFVDVFILVAHFTGWRAFFLFFLASFLILRVAKRHRGRISQLHGGLIFLLWAQHAMKL